MAKRSLSVIRQPGGLYSLFMAYTPLFSSSVSDLVRCQLPGVHRRLHRLIDNGHRAIDDFYISKYNANS